MQIRACRGLVNEARLVGMIEQRLRVSKRSARIEWQLKGLRRNSHWRAFHRATII
jgi:hypothetical protein